MKNVISCSSLVLAATLGLGGLAGCEESDTVDVSGNIRKPAADTPKVDPNAMPGGGAGAGTPAGGGGGGGGVYRVPAAAPACPIMPRCSKI